jgi:hypothetical protein
MNRQPSFEGARVSPLRRAIAASLLGLASGLAASQPPWPSKPIRIIVPFPPAGRPMSPRA